MKLPTSTRARHGAVAVLCMGLLSFGYYLQFFQGQDPCPLCIFQRVAYMAVTVIALAAVVVNPVASGRLAAGAALFLAAAIGGGIAGRQVWLQHLPPDRVPECGPGLDYILEVFPLSDALGMVFTGSGECAEVSWRFLFLSIAEWSLIWFAVIAVVAVLECRAAFNHRNAGGPP